MIATYYDQLNTSRKDIEFFMALLKGTKAKNIADLGCGTGQLTIELAKADYVVTGIDPNTEAIQVAQNKADAERVTWITGDSQHLENGMYDAVLMTANVAQVFITDENWKTVLKHTYKALKPGGHFIFDSRNPEAKIWEEWLKDDTVEQLHDIHTGEPLLYWDEYEGFSNDIFIFQEKVKNLATDKTYTAEIQLIFRSQAEIVNALRQTGFTTVDTYEDWTLQTATSQAKSFIFHCVK